MSGYTPIFNTVFDGTLCGKWPESAVWLTILALCDKHGEVNLSYAAICARTGWPPELLRQGIEALMAPDPDSQTPDEEGRRLVLLDPGRTWGWRIVNHEKYREKARLRSKDARRTESGEDAARKREERMSPAVPRRPTESPSSSSSSNTTTDSRKDTTAAARPADDDFEVFKLIYPPRGGGNPWSKALKAIHARLREGHTWPQILDGTRRYAAFVKATGKQGTEYVKHAATFCGPDKSFLEAWALPATKAQVQQNTNVDAGLQWLRDSETPDAIQ